MHYTQVPNVTLLNHCTEAITKSTIDKLPLMHFAIEINVIVYCTVLHAWNWLSACKFIIKMLLQISHFMVKLTF